MNTKPNFHPNFDASVFLRTCEKEVIEPIEGKITGTIPSWLNGTLIRNGPGQLKIGDCEVNHIFDSMALLQKFNIQNGQVTFQCRFLQSDIYKANTKANRIVLSDFGTRSVPDPCKSIFNRFFSIFEKKGLADNASVSVYPFGDELYAFCENPFMFKVDKETLETVKKANMRYLNIVSHTAHPHVTEDGTVYNLALSSNGPRHCIVRFPKKPPQHVGDYSMYDKAEMVTTIPVRWRFYPSYMHTFGITPNYFVLLEQPLTLSASYLARKILTNAPIFSIFKFFANELTQISIISRSTGKLSYTFTADTFFYLHIINQYEEDNHIVLDVCSYEDSSILEGLGVKSLRDIHNDLKYSEIFKSTPIRLVLPLIDSHDSIKLNENLVTIKNTNATASLQKSGTIHAKWEIITKVGCELPTTNYEKQLGLKYKFFYAISGDIDGDYPGSLIKVDVENKMTTRWCEENCFANEAVFVPSPNSESEDDGVILSNIVWGMDDTHRTGLVVLDAKTMQEIGRAEFKTPGAINIGFHGWYSPNEKFQDI